jgi:hypothetical protein
MFEQKTELMRLLDVSSRAEGVRIYIGGESQVVPFEELRSSPPLRSRRPRRRHAGRHRPHAHGLRPHDPDRRHHGAPGGQRAVASSKKAAEAAARPGTIKDGDGLTLIARPDGAGWWRLRYWLSGRENRLSLGTYPEVPLKLARERRDDARKLIAAGTDPSEPARPTRRPRRCKARGCRRWPLPGLPGPGTFEHAAREWHAYMAASWSPGHAVKVLALLTNDLFPYIGARPLAELTAPELLKHARRVEARGATETAYRALKAAGAVFRFGVQHGYCESDPTRDLKGAIQLPIPEHRAAVTDPVKLGELLRAIDGYQGTPAVRAALALAPLVFLRPGELRKAEWAEFDLDGAVWTVPAARMKGRLKAKQNGPVMWCRWRPRPSPSCATCTR